MGPENDPVVDMVVKLSCVRNGRESGRERGDGKGRESTRRAERVACWGRGELYKVM